MIPDYVQKNYDRTLSDGLPGGNADLNPTHDGSFVAYGSDIGFGLVISEGAGSGLPVRGFLGGTAVQSATAGYGIGTGTPELEATIWAAISDGEFSLVIDGVPFDASGLDFSSVTDLDGVATVIQNKIQSYTAGGAAFTAATVVFDATNYQFKVTSGTTGAASTVKYFDNVDGGYGTNVLEELGFDSAEYVAGQAAVVSATVLGVTMRHVVEEGGAGNASDTTVIPEGSIGAFRQDGTLKVRVQEDCSKGGDVYFVDATGEIVATSGSGRTQLGSAVFKGSYSKGAVGIIDIKGLR